MQLSLSTQFVKKIEMEEQKIEIKFGGIKTVNKRVENFVHQWLFLGKFVEFEHKGLTYPKIGCSDIRNTPF